MDRQRRAVPTPQPLFDPALAATREPRADDPDPFERLAREHGPQPAAYTRDDAQRRRQPRRRRDQEEAR